jgi:hypothetical protein
MDTYQERAPGDRHQAPIHRRQRPLGSVVGGSHNAWCGHPPRDPRRGRRRTISTFSCDIARAVSRRLRSRRERLAPTARRRRGLRLRYGSCPTRRTYLAATGLLARAPVPRGCRCRAVAAKAHGRDRNVSKVAHFNNLDFPVGEGAEPVFHPAAHSFVAVIAAVHASRERDGLHLIVRKCHQGIEVAPVEDVNGSVNQLHVLLRHRPRSIPQAQGSA